jgi:hypothetical protein
VDRSRFAEKSHARWRIRNETAEDPEDEIGVVTAWTRPGLFDNMTTAHLFAVQKAIAAGQWREDAQSPDWAGNAVANVLDLDATAPADKTRIKTMLEAWIGNKVLKIVEKPDAKRRLKRFPKSAFGQRNVPRQGSKLAHLLNPKNTHASLPHHLATPL